MTCLMKERYILAYFNTPEQAENIRQQLALADGIIDTQVNRIGLYPEPQTSHFIKYHYRE
ncbi:hypothetical protein [Aneurinibacillus thermoaerophilus]|uniref:Uncharacterized protein n=2 Tax=Aneurinibacillus group TaxID=85151 RepID=A0ABX8YC90_ANETH|nr:hypothetical protein [Aneurinibacillus thermoaerophilus]MED0674202.1 hypothetical protein [Aneurinibacillus thermoaerophilus]MED0736755.1 hypothetical protein [Aneurinibacillus thermoaerophilus]MED0766091.1 hypothetical protein [Aneurinibacillus thermoaerophilus]QYY43061.1 hypothetical protein K3F53_01735 [Aneurinibacillus thermoaerophilus]